MGRIETRLAELGIVLPTPSSPSANYVSYVITGDLVVMSGQIPVRDGKVAYTGKLGDVVSIDNGTQAAQLCFINLLAQLRVACNGDLNRVQQVVRLGGFIACVPEFTQHALVMNGASDMSVAVFDEAGRHARSTIGVPSLPLNAAVEVEGIFRIA